MKVNVTIAAVIRQVTTATSMSHVLFSMLKSITGKNRRGYGVFTPSAMVFPVGG